MSETIRTATVEKLTVEELATTMLEEGVTVVTQDAMLDGLPWRIIVIVHPAHPDGNRALVKDILSRIPE